MVPELAEVTTSEATDTSPVTKTMETKLAAPLILVAVMAAVAAPAVATAAVAEAEAVAAAVVATDEPRTNP